MTHNLSGSSRLCRAVAFLLCLGFLFSCPLFSRGEESCFSLSLPQEVKGYTHCEITVQAPAAGELLGEQQLHAAAAGLHRGGRADADPV